MQHQLRIYANYFIIPEDDSIDLQHPIKSNEYQIIIFELIQGLIRVNYDDINKDFPRVLIAIRTVIILANCNEKPSERERVQMGKNGHRERAHVPVERRELCGRCRGPRRKRRWRCREPISQSKGVATSGD